MTRWQYFHLQVDASTMTSSSFSAQMTAQLNDLGNDGWELVTSFASQKHGYSHELFLVFKRPIVPRQDG